MLDLHTPPGGRDPVYGDLFLINQTYQDHFFEVLFKFCKNYGQHLFIYFIIRCGGD